MGKQPFYVEKYGEKSLTNCDIVDEFGLYLPNHPGLTDEDLDLIINTVNAITG
jgi:dTDP-4-amino-4,6-dideoxygalactose transaminase